MKTTLLSLIIMLAGVYSYGASDPVIIDAVPKSIYLPSGFDTNDNSQLVFEGKFVNSCYRTGITTYSVDQASKTIEVQNKVQFYENQMCLMVVSSYMKELNLGVLAKGDYKVSFKSALGEKVPMGVLKVDKANSANADDELYAPIDTARFDTDSKALILSGAFSNRCMYMKDILVRSNGSPNVIHVLPIAGVRANCDAGEADAQETFRVGVEFGSYEQGRYLLHVRSLSGQAKNVVVNL